MTTDTGRGYGEAWPGGPWVHSGILPPGAGEDVLHFRVARDGRIIGQGAVSDPPPALYWTGTAWLNLGPTSGISIGAFHPSDGTVYVSDITGVRIYGRDGVQVGMMPGYLGSQGIRWIDPDGTVHSGDATNADPPLWQWTEIGDIRVGQGGPDAPDEGVRLVGPDGVLRAINSDVARFIRVNAEADIFAICYLRLTDGANARIVGSRAELLAMPPVVVAPPPPEPPPEPPPPPPVVPPEPPPVPEPIPEPTDPVLPPAAFYGGFVWPLDPMVSQDSLPAVHLRTFRLLGFNAIRIDAGLYNPGGFDLMRQLGHAGLMPLPVLAVNMTNPDAGIADAAVYVQRLAQSCSWVHQIEVMNEPASHVSASDYARLAIGVGETFHEANPHAHVILAGEMANFGNGQMNPWWPEVKRLVPADLYDGVAIHPYRNPKPWSFSAWGSREAELAMVREQIGDKALHVTETGWHLDEPDYAANIINELDFWRITAKAASVYIYAMVGEKAKPPDWGLCENDPNTGVWTPNPAAIQLSYYFDEFPL